jgi:pyruvate kinase
MRRIIAAAEQRLAETVTAPSPAARLMKSRYRTAALAHGAWHVARDVGAKLIACWSQQGGTARYLSQTGTTIPIIAYSSDEREVRRMALLRGVYPRLFSLGGTGLAVHTSALSSHHPSAKGGTGGSPASGEPQDPPSTPTTLSNLSLSAWNTQVEQDLLTLGWIQPGDPIILVAGKPLGVKGATCSLAIHYTGNKNTGYMRM